MADSAEDSAEGRARGPVIAAAYLRIRGDAIKAAQEACERW